MTAKYTRLWILFLIATILCNIGPLAYYSAKALIVSDLVYEKVALAGTVFVVLILSCIALVNKVALRSRLWIILIGLWCCLDNFIEPLIVIACCQTLDELIITPLRIHFKTKLTIHKELDKRL